MKAPMLLAFVGLLISTAQAAEPTGTLTLACQGTASSSALSPDAEREPVSVGIIVNFDSKTIEGIGGKFSIRIHDDDGVPARKGVFPSRTLRAP